MESRITLFTGHGKAPAKQSYPPFHTLAIDTHLPQYQLLPSDKDLHLHIFTVFPIFCRRSTKLFPEHLCEIALALKATLPA